MLSRFWPAMWVHCWNCYEDASVTNASGYLKLRMERVRETDTVRVAIVRGVTCFFSLNRVRSPDNVVGQGISLLRFKPAHLSYECS
jgi:NADPH-dependent curcumin reductase CurA